MEEEEGGTPLRTPTGWPPPPDHCLGPSPALEIPGGGLEFLERTLSRPLALEGLPHWKFQAAAWNFSGGGSTQ